MTSSEISNNQPGWVFFHHCSHLSSVKARFLASLAFHKSTTFSFQETQKLLLYSLSCTPPAAPGSERVFFLSEFSPMFWGLQKRVGQKQVSVSKLILGINTCIVYHVYHVYHVYLRLSVQSNHSLTFQHKQFQSGVVDSAQKPHNLILEGSNWTCTG